MQVSRHAACDGWCKHHQPCQTQQRSQAVACLLLSKLCTSSCCFTDVHDSVEFASPLRHYRRTHLHPYYHVPRGISALCLPQCRLRASSRGAAHNACHATNCWPVTPATKSVNTNRLSLAGPNQMISGLRQHLIVIRMTNNLPEVTDRLRISPLAVPP